MGGMSGIIWLWGVLVNKEQKNKYEKHRRSSNTKPDCTTRNGGGGRNWNQMVGNFFLSSGEDQKGGEAEVFSGIRGEKRRPGEDLINCKKKKKGDNRGKKKGGAGDARKRAKADEDAKTDGTIRPRGQPEKETKTQKRGIRKKEGAMKQS